MSAVRNYIEDLAVRGRHHFTPEEVQAATGGSRNAVTLALHRLSRRGRVAHPARGFYVGVPPEYRILGCLPAEQFVPTLMELSGTDYYVGLLSAAQYHGAAHHRPQEFQVLTEKRRRSITCGGVRVVFVFRKSLADVPTRLFNTLRGTVRVSTPEATAVDLVGYPRRAGGLDNVATVLAELAEVIDPELLLAAVRTAPVTWAQRLGYLLELAGEADKAKLLRPWVRDRARDTVALLPCMPRDGAVRNSDWKLDVNVEVDIEV